MIIGFSSRPAPKLASSPKNHFDIFRDIRPAARIRHIDQMHQQARALDVPQKLRAQPRAGVRALDQSRNVGDHKTDFALRGSPTTTTPRFGSSVVNG